MPDLLLLNPNTNAQTTQMMVQLVQAQCPAQGHWVVHGCTAAYGVPMITNAAELAVAATQVQHCWQQARSQRAWVGVLLACFADPALDWLRSATGVPTIGIGEAAMRAASQGGQRFGIATTTPDLDTAMRAQAHALGLGSQYTGPRYTAGNPHHLVARPGALQQQLHTAVQQCVRADGAHCVVIGGGPLGQAAHHLDAQVQVPLIAPLTAAAQWLVQACTTPALPDAALVPTHLPHAPLPHADTANSLPERAPDSFSSH